MNPFHVEFTPEQAEAIQIMLGPDQKGKTHIFAHGTGLGKTYMSLGGFEALRRSNEGVKFHMVVFCPKNAVKAFKRECDTKAFYEYSLCIASMSQQYFDVLDDFKMITICEYSVIDKARHYLQKVFQQGNVILVLDELHKLKNPKSLRTSLVIPFMKKVRCIWGLTATPVLNHLIDTYEMVNLLFPGSIGQRAYFQRRYMIVELKNVMGKKRFVQVGVRNLETLEFELRPYVHYKYNPMDIRFHYLTTHFTEEEEALYLMAARGILAEDERQFAGRLPDLQVVTDGSVKEGRVINKDLMQLSSKEQLLLTTISKKIRDNEPVIVYTCAKKTLYRLINLLKMRFVGHTVFVITGETDGRERELIESQFGPGCILLITGAGGESLNLQTSNQIVFFNLPFKVDEFIQVVGRIARMDSEHTHMDVFILEVKDSIDTYKRLLLRHHSDKIKTVQSVSSPNLMSTKDSMNDYELIARMRRDLLWRLRSRNIVNTSTM